MIGNLIEENLIGRIAREIRELGGFSGVKIRDTALDKRKGTTSH